MILTRQSWQVSFFLFMAISFAWKTLIALKMIAFSFDPHSPFDKPKTIEYIEYNFCWHYVDSTGPAKIHSVDLLDICWTCSYPLSCTLALWKNFDPDTDSLAWWKDNSDKYSRLSVLARRYLAVPATYVPSERIFSAAGLIVTKLRHCLASIKLFSLTKTLYHNDRITIMNVK